MRILNELITCFFLYSFIGWLIETIICSIYQKRLVYRGFLLGPYCPIYGFIASFITVLTYKYVDWPVLVYIFSFLSATVGEYVISFILEKAFHMTWWDYTNYKINLHGRVALVPSLFWGLLGLVLVYVVNPFVFQISASLYDMFSIWPSIIIIGILFIDYITTIYRLDRFKKYIQRLEKSSAAIRNIEEYEDFLMYSFKNQFMPSVKRQIKKRYPDIYKALFPKKR